ncbi:hypothetical protein [Shimia sediminis]|uniref:hypothetical protein n=1 Tax=Shimia sediminis TaxID=2497945 RepID=UPI000F8D8227|nr:hypothetical protein [Shimia sediminis]
MVAMTFRPLGTLERVTRMKFTFFEQDYESETEISTKETWSLKGNVLLTEVTEVVSVRFGNDDNPSPELVAEAKKEWLNMGQIRDEITFLAPDHFQLAGISTPLDCKLQGLDPTS